MTLLVGSIFHMTRKIVSEMTYNVSMGTLNPTIPYHTFPAEEHHRPLTSTKLYCLVTEAHVCEQLAQGCYMKVERPGFEPATSEL